MRHDPRYRTQICIALYQSQIAEQRGLFWKWSDPRGPSVPSFPSSAVVLIHQGGKTYHRSRGKFDGKRNRPFIVGYPTEIITDNLLIHQNPLRARPDRRLDVLSDGPQSIAPFYFICVPIHPVVARINPPLDRISVPDVRSRKIAGMDVIPHLHGHVEQAVIPQHSELGTQVQRVRGNSLELVEG